jgi:peptidoglycan hydrolase FlgJ
MNDNVTNSTSGTSADDISQRFALDVQGFNAMRQAAKASPQQGAWMAAKQFDAVFTQMMLKSMREATPQDGIMDSNQTKTFTDMLDQQLSEQLSSKGIGLADQMYAQLMRGQNAGTEGEEGSGAFDAVRAYENQAGTTPSGNGSLAAAKGFSETDNQTDQGELVRSASTASANAAEFVSKLAASAQAASSTTGIPARYILSQAALESGWGKKEIKRSDGSTTHNIFGIKAGKDWTGATVLAHTTEYVNGVAHQVVQRFRAYGSYDEAVKDYANMLNSNPRFAAVVQASRDPASFARGMQNAGYATDPHYAKKLMSIMRQLV